MGLEGISDLHGVLTNNLGANIVAILGEFLGEEGAVLAVTSQWPHTDVLAGHNEQITRLKPTVKNNSKGAKVAFIRPNKHTGDTLSTRDSNVRAKEGRDHALLSSRNHDRIRHAPILPDILEGVVEKNFVKVNTSCITNIGTGCVTNVFSHTAHATALSVVRWI